ncbi:TatD family hydrolase [Collinsella tanakaei]|uniref:TatD family hydrolase n=1 Tax=Collinsella tanakaei TaxID=626935 RepID=UPI0025A3D4AE|nr:TatD family hydrolase [Collinsella tanakaei]MDM8299879.1 TatD family hydrolase [Collinsella tanakaei]
MKLYDMHCHLELMSNAAEVSRDAAQLGIGLLDATVTPAAFAQARKIHADAPAVRVAAGLHPWWLDDGRCDRTDIEMLVAQITSCPYVGEVGLDFSQRHAASADLQTEAFDAIVQACASHPLPGRLLTIHAVRATGTVLDVLERHGLDRSAACIIHWFSGTSDELTRARRVGCLFSINGRMLATKRGREYARVIPEDSLLLETDAPPGDGPYSALAIKDELEETLSHLAEIRGVDACELGKRIVERSAALLAID